MPVFMHVYVRESVCVCVVCTCVYVHACVVWSKFVLFFIMEYLSEWQEL